MIYFLCEQCVSSASKTACAHRLVRMYYLKNLALSIMMADTLDLMISLFLNHIGSGILFYFLYFMAADSVNLKIIY